MKIIPGESKGVYYSFESYASFGERVGAWIVDLLFLLGLTGGYLLIFWFSSDRSAWGLAIVFWLFIITCFMVLAVLKRTDISTPGFWIFGIKIVDLQGRKPSLLKMIFRCLLLAPFNLFTDLMWLTSEKSRQTLRDKVAGTYVIKRSATPLGKA